MTPLPDDKKNSSITDFTRRETTTRQSNAPSPAPDEKHLVEAFYKRYGVCYSTTRTLVRKIAGGITLSLREIYNTLIISDKQKDK